MQHIVPIRFLDLWLALDADQVEQILGQQTWMRLPGGSRVFPGVMAWRGRAAAVLNLAAILPEDDSDLPRVDRPPRTIVVRSHECSIAIPVDEIREAQLIEPGQLKPQAITHQRYAQGEIDLGGQILAVLDLDALIDATLGPLPTKPAGRT